MKRLKKITAIAMLSLTLFNSIFCSYSMTVQASAVLPDVSELTFLDSILTMFGINIGLGNQYDFWSQQETIDDIFTGISTGEVVTFDNYGDVDFNDSESITTWLEWCADYNDYALGNIPTDSASYDAACNVVLKALDNASYVNSGTAASTAMNKSITDLIELYKVAGDGDITLGLQEAAGLVSGNGDNDDPHLDWNKYVALAGLAAANLISNASKIKDSISSLVSTDDTEFTQYSGAFGVAGDYDWTGSYQMTSDGQYIIHAHYFFYDSNELVLNSVVSKMPVAFYSGTYTYIYIDGQSYKPDSSDISVIAGMRPSGVFNATKLIGINIPVFTDYDAAIASSKAGALQGTEYIINLFDTSAYTDFKSNTGSAMDTLSDPLSDYLAGNPSLTDIAALLAAINAKMDGLAGTADLVPAIAAAVAEAVGDKDDSNDDTTTVINYSGLLNKILSAIKAIAASIWEFFESPIEKIAQGVTDIVDTVPGLLSGISDVVISLPEVLDAILEAVASIPALLESILEGINPYNPIDDGSGSGGGTVNLLNGILLLVYILLKLLQIFLHLLEFIVNVFKIPASPGFIEGDFATGFNYIKTVQLSPLNISIYDFLMGLIHISLIFGVVKVLKKHIDKLHV